MKKNILFLFNFIFFLTPFAIINAQTQSKTSGINVVEKYIYLESRKWLLLERQWIWFHNRLLDTFYSLRSQVHIFELTLNHIITKRVLVSNQIKSPKRFGLIAHLFLFRKFQMKNLLLNMRKFVSINFFINLQKEKIEMHHMMFCRINDSVTNRD